MSFNHYQPTEIINIHDINYYSWDKYKELIYLRYKIGGSLIIDCVTYLGLHKLINFDDLEEDLNLLFKALFTNYQSNKITSVYLTWIDELNQSIEDNNLLFVSEYNPNMAELLIDWILFKVEHYKILGKLLSHEIKINEYYKFIKDCSFDDYYPFTQYESN